MMEIKKKTGEQRQTLIKWGMWQCNPISCKSTTSKEQCVKDEGGDGLQDQLKEQVRFTRLLGSAELVSAESH